MQQIFVSKRDRWLTIVMAATLILVALAMVPMIAAAAARASASHLIGIVVAVLTLALAGSVLAATKYVVDGDRLEIRSGPFRWNVAIAEIVRVSKTDDPSSAPALSLDRLSIEYRRGEARREILVSPRDQEGFVRLITTLNPRIETPERA